MMRRLADIVAGIAAERIRERQLSDRAARKQSALFAWEVMGDMTFRYMVNFLEARIHSRTDSDPAALRDLGHRLCRLADEVERRDGAGREPHPQNPPLPASLYKAGL